MTELDHTREFRFLTRAGWGDAVCHLFQYDELNAAQDWPHSGDCHTRDTDRTAVRDLSDDEDFAGIRWQPNGGSIPEVPRAVQTSKGVVVTVESADIGFL